MSLEERIGQLIAQMTLVEKVAMLSGKDCMDTRTNKRLGIPSLKMADGPHGVRWDHATSFPTGVAMGSTWNPELIEAFGSVLARETLAKGRNMILGPCVNIHRTPLGGRNFESFSEDPYLTARITVAYVKGVQRCRVGTSTKHFACNNQEHDRHTVSAEVDERTLHEIYLPAFKAAVQEADTWSVMGAYNKVNGTYCCEHPHLLMDILRDEWGFEGIAISDWSAVHSTDETALSGLDLEMPGPGIYLNEPLRKAVEEGRIAEEVLDGKVRNILRVMFKMGLMDETEDERDVSLDVEAHRAMALEMARESIVLLKNDRAVLPLDKASMRRVAVLGPNAAVARLGGGGSSTVDPLQAVSPLEGIQTLCGDDIEVTFAVGCSMPGDLPPVEQKFFRPADGGPDERGLRAEYFDNTELIGEPVDVRVERQVNFDWGGGTPVQGLQANNFSARWTGLLIPEQTTEYELGTISTDEIKLYIDNELLIECHPAHAAEFQSTILKLEAGNPYDIRIEYRAKKGWPVAKLGWIPAHDMQEAVERARTADVAIVFAGLSSTFEGEGADRADMCLPGEQEALIEAVAEANSNTVVVLVNGTPVLMEDWLKKVPVVVEAWYPGQEGGTALAEVLFGVTNPSGRLSTTLPARLEETAAFGNYPGENGRVRFEEGLFVGYRYFDKHGVEPLFPFGHGLSYTTFEYSDLEISAVEGNQGICAQISFDVQNTGACEGKEVAQIYVHDLESSLVRPAKELKAFSKLSLQPGEKIRVEISLGSDAFAFYDPDGKGWTVEPGDFEILVGHSSRDIRLQEVFTLEAGLAEAVASH